MNDAFIEELGTSANSFSRRSFEKEERISVSHGQTLHEIQALREGKFDRVADMVVYIETQEHAERLVELAVKHNVALVPCGGATNVTHSLELPEKEKRMLVVVEMTRMKKIKWVDQ